MLQAGAALTILLALLFTSDSQAYRESIMIALVAASVYGYLKIVRRKSVVRWWKAWVANFVAVLLIAPFAVAGGAPAEAVGEMLGMITIPGAISAAALVPLSKGLHNRHLNKAQASADTLDRRVPASQRPAPARPEWLRTAWMRSNMKVRSKG